MKLERRIQNIERSAAFRKAEESSLEDALRKFLMIGAELAPDFEVSSASVIEIAAYLYATEGVLRTDVVKKANDIVAGDDREASFVRLMFMLRDDIEEGRHQRPCIET